MGPYLSTWRKAPAAVPRGHAAKRLTRAHIRRIVVGTATGSHIVIERVNDRPGDHTPACGRTSQGSRPRYSPSTSRLLGSRAHPSRARRAVVRRPPPRLVSSASASLGESHHTLHASGPEARPGVSWCRRRIPPRPRGLTVSPTHRGAVVLPGPRLSRRQSQSGLHDAGGGTGPSAGASAPAMICSTQVVRP